jgi:hypothetical protein
MSSGTPPATIGQGAAASGPGLPAAESTTPVPSVHPLENREEDKETISEPLVDAGAVRTSDPAKLERKRVRSAEPKVSIFGLWELWLMPFLAEVVLLFGAAWLSYCLLQVVQNQAADFPVASILVLVAAYAGLAVYSRLQELFLPRKVVFLGVGVLLLLAAAISAFAQVDALLVGGNVRWFKVALVLTPLHLFVLRCLLVFREARYAPTAASLSRRMSSKAERIESLRRKIRFWMS